MWRALHTAAVAAALWCTEAGVAALIQQRPPPLQFDMWVGIVELRGCPIPNLCLGEGGLTWLPLPTDPSSAGLPPARHPELRAQPCAWLSGDGWGEDAAVVSPMPHASGTRLPAYVRKANLV